MKFRRENKGVALVLAIIILLMVFSMAVVFLSSSFFQAKTTGQATYLQKALEIAEAGIAVAAEEIKGTVDYPGGTGNAGVGNVTGNFGGGAYAVTAVKDPTPTVERYTLNSLGTYAGSSRRIQVVLEPTILTPFSKALFGDKFQVDNGNITTDSYDSRNGAYGAALPGGVTNVGSKGDIASNGDITLKGSSIVINGNVTPGPTGSIIMTGSAKVTGSTAPETALSPLPIPVYNPPGTSSGALTPIGTQTLSSGSYRYSSYSQSGKNDLIINGAVTLYIDGILTKRVAALS